MSLIMLRMMAFLALFSLTSYVIFMGGVKVYPSAQPSESMVHPKLQKRIDMKKDMPELAVKTGEIDSSILSHLRKETSRLDKHIESLTHDLPKALEKESSILSSKMGPGGTAIASTGLSNFNQVGRSVGRQGSNEAFLPPAEPIHLAHNTFGIDSNKIKMPDTKIKLKSYNHASFKPKATSEEDIARDKWTQRLVRKMKCVKRGRSGIFLYHVRKAAGTTLRDILEEFTKRWSVQLFEVEGLSLDARYLTFPKQISTFDVNFPPTDASLLSITSLRDPVARIMSLYWYEHVGWWDGIVKKPGKCKPLSTWVAAWRDDSAWKKNFMLKNPGSVYVEVENYYVKMLIGWKGHQDGPLTQEHLAQAKKVLRSFDLIVLTEWMADARQIDAINALFPGRNIIATKHMVRGDKKMKDRLKPKLAPDEASVYALLTKINALDMQLWKYAKSLVARRLKIVGSEQVRQALQEKDTDSTTCGPKIAALGPVLDSQLGIHQPPGHKGPL